MRDGIVGMADYSPIENRRVGRTVRPFIAGRFRNVEWGEWGFDRVKQTRKAMAKPGIFPAFQGVLEADARFCWRR